MCCQTDMRCATASVKSVSIIIPFCLLFATCVGAAGLISIQHDRCSATVDPATLETHLKGGDRPAVLVSVAQTNLGRIADLQTSAARARWSLPDRKVTVTFELKDNRLLAHVLATDPGEFTFPVIPETAAAKGWILPLFEGVYAPGGDVKWQTFLTQRGKLNTTADLTMPFLGLDCGSYTLTCILTNPFNNELEFHRAPDARLHARLTHQFTRNHPVKEYGLVFQLGTNSLVEPARLYRQWLIQRGEFVSLQDKIRRTPEAAKLMGAAHIYLWGQELLDQADVTDWKQLARELQTQGQSAAPSPAERIWSLMRPEAKGFVTNLVQAQWLDKYTKEQVADDLNRLLMQTRLLRRIGLARHLADCGSL